MTSSLYELEQALKFAKETEKEETERRDKIKTKHYDSEGSIRNQLYEQLQLAEASLVKAKERTLKAAKDVENFKNHGKFLDERHRVLNNQLSDPKPKDAAYVKEFNDVNREKIATLKTNLGLTGKYYSNIIDDTKIYIHKQSLLELIQLYEELITLHMKPMASESLDVLFNGKCDNPKCAEDLFIMNNKIIELENNNKEHKEATHLCNYSEGGVPYPQFHCMKVTPKGKLRCKEHEGLYGARNKEYQGGD